MSRNDEPFVNTDLIDSINWVVDDTILHDETYKVWEHDLERQEQMHLSELGRIFGNFTKSDFACAVITAFRNYPYMVLQCIAEELTKKEGENNG